MPTLGGGLGVRGGAVRAKPSCLEGNQGCFGAVGVPWSPHPPLTPCSSGLWITWAHLVGAEVEQSDGSCGQVSLQSLWPFVACSQSSPMREPDPAPGSPIPSAGEVTLLCSLPAQSPQHRAWACWGLEGRS